MSTPRMTPTGETVAVTAMELRAPCSRRYLVNSSAFRPPGVKSRRRPPASRGH